MEKEAEAGWEATGGEIGRERAGEKGGGGEQQIEISSSLLRAGTDP